jgi:hypothetical protein
VYARFDFTRLRPDRFRAAHPAIGLRIMEPAGLPELVEGKIDVLIARHLGDHPGYRGECLGNDSNDPGAGDFLICPAGTAKLPGDRKPARMAPGRRCRDARRAFRPSRRAPLALSSIAELSTLALEEIP